jgi:hypothetical protein
MKDLKIVIIESPYDCWNESEVGTLFRDMIGVKLRGYGREYKYGVLPVDAADLISTHFAVCFPDETGKLKPIMALRWTSLQKCKLHFLNFPGMSLLQQANQPEHVRNLEQKIENLNKRNGDLYYAGSLSIDPLLKTGKEQSLLLRELMTTMFVLYKKQHPGSELMAGGTVRFKMDQWLSAVGHAPLHEEPINVKHLGGELVKVMYLTEFSFEAHRIAKKWQHLWDERLILDGSQQNITKKKTA